MQRGSDDKDIVAQPFAQIAGAEVCSTLLFVRSLGLVTLAASPAQKHAALLVSLELARLTRTPDALRRL